MKRRPLIAQLLLVILGCVHVVFGAYTESNLFYLQSTIYIAASLIVFGLSREE